MFPAETGASVTTTGAVAGPGVVKVLTVAEVVPKEFVETAR